MTLAVHPIAYTVFNRQLFEELTGFASEDGATDADALAEAAGRNCYQSWDRPNRKTATNAGYIGQALHEHQHWSIAEHATITFLITGLSRSAHTQLVRHRHLSPSVISQRFVTYEESKPAVPPALVEGGLEYLVYETYDDLLALYAYLVKQLERQGFKRKQAREAARAILPEAAPVSMVITGNARAWHEYLIKRHHEAADREAQDLAAELLKHLRGFAPNIFADIPEQPIGNDTNRRSGQ